MPGTLADQFASLWEPDHSPPDVFAFLDSHTDAPAVQRREVLMADQSRRWRTDRPITVEQYLAKQPDLAADEDAVLDLAAGEYRARRSIGQTVSVDEFVARFAHLAEAIRNRLSAAVASTGKWADKLDNTLNENPRAQSGTTAVFVDSETVPQKRIGRYRLIRLLGQGGFGRVWLAHDDELKRQVAVKVPKPERFKGPRDAEAYLIEAQTVAKLDHPNIVPVFDVGKSDDGSIYVVSKFVEGGDLAKRMKVDRPSFEESARLLATAAAALHHAHDRRLIHRDVKPANILLDENARQPFIADFGLATTENDPLQDGIVAGTAAYMSPEQARGEGHRLDGRSDIFSLGVVLYELLTAKKPFQGATRNEVLHNVMATDPIEPKKLDGEIPIELQRICLKSLSKRASDRYATGLAFADDLLHWIADPDEASVKEVRIVPRGLRSFGADDADFFLDLLPGPRDRDGLPESVRFWKTRIDQTDPDKTFTVGLLYGPSGCGKSSLVKAALLPRLNAHVICVYVEATPNESESRILRGIRKQFPMTGSLGMSQAFTALRRDLVPEGKKLVIILDQFEQWLHGNRCESDAELVRALRQCDGRKVQAVCMIRDDFWMAAERFSAVLDVDFQTNINALGLDLFSLEHARKVMAAFGRAYLRFPDGMKEQHEVFIQRAVEGLSQDGRVVSVRLSLFADMMREKPWNPSTLDELGGTEGVGVTFLEETFVARGAAPNHRVHQQAARAVLRSLLPDTGADIKGHMKSHEDLLQASGYAGRERDFNDLLRILDGELRLITPTDPDGVAGREWRVVGENDDDGSTLSGTGCVAVGDGVGGELLSAVQDVSEGGAVRPDNSDSVGGRIDSGEHRRGPGKEAHQERHAKITRSTPEAKSLPATHYPPPATRHYQLTHDYLVPSLREWLTRKQKETRKGRAELRLEERAGLWNSKPENCRLPSCWEWVTIRAFTDRETWTEPQRKMMKRAGRAHGMQKGLVLLVICFIAWGLFELLMTLVSSSLTESIRIAETARVPELARSVVTYRRWTVPRVERLLRKSPRDSRARLNASLALAPIDPGQVDYLKKRLFMATPDDARVISLTIRPYCGKVIDAQWRILESTGQRTRDGVLQAASALAVCDPDSSIWSGVASRIVEVLVNEPPLRVAVWIENFRPVRRHFIKPLATIFRSQPGEREQTQIDLATGVLVEYAADDLKNLAQLVLDAQPKQFVALIEGLAAHGNEASTIMSAELDRAPVKNWQEAEKEALARRQANAAVALLRMGETAKVWPLLKHRPDPRLRSWIVHLLRRLDADPAMIARRLDRERDVSIRRALILSLGEFEDAALVETDTLKKRLLEWYEHDPDSGVHAAAEWVLRRRGHSQLLHDIDANLATNGPTPTKRWYINSQGQTMVVISGPVEYMMGSPPTEKSRGKYEELRQVELNRSFAIAAKELTGAQFNAFLRATESLQDSKPKPDSADQEFPHASVSWFQAAAYCRWLSEKERIAENQMCYPPIPDIKAEMKLPADILQRTGYRLPVEEEWEFACRAGASTSRYYGQSENLLGKYAWYLENADDHVWPVGLLKPNDFGLFDMHGNVWEWCQEPLLRVTDGEKSTPAPGRTDAMPKKTATSHLVRGGSYNSFPHEVRSADRTGYNPARASANIGFRVARTLPLEQKSVNP